MLMEQTPAILVVDDEEYIRQIIEGYLLVDGFFVKTAASAAEAKAFAQEQPYHLLITDWKMPEEDGIALARFFRTHYPRTGIMLVTGHPNSDALKTIEELEISSLLIKPFTAHQLKFSVLGALQKQKMLFQETGRPDDDGKKKDDLGLIGNSVYMNELRAQIRLLARGDFPLLIQGPSGTGKEVIANAIHRCSGRSERSLVTINCAAIPEHLEESEFFGYAKGAFTGANMMKHGIIASADKSSLFLDEISELSLNVQAKLLRVLDTGEYLRIGETASQMVDLRIVSATNLNLEDMVEEGLFREDLYFRLKGAIIITKPLLEYREDIPPLVCHFLNSQKDSRVPRHITADAMALLAGHHWPGNIRELKHTVNYLCTAALGLKNINRETVMSVMKIKDGGPNLDLPYYEAKDKIVGDFDHLYFTKLLQKFNGNVNQASKSAGMHRPYLVKKLKELAINSGDFKGALKAKTAPPATAG